MPTRKQRRRMQKERRHEYETIWVDGEGNELEEPPDDVATPGPERPQDGKKPQQKRPQQRSSRPTRTPLPASWRRALRRSLILGAVIFVAFTFLSSKNGKPNYVSALLLAVLYTALFIPFTYYLDRFVFRRWERQNGGQAKKR